MRPLPLIGAAILLLFLVVRRHKLGRLEQGGALLVIAGCLLVGLGIVKPPNFQKVIEDTATTLGPYTYVLVGALAFLETGAFIGLIAPGETAVLVGGVVAGQGQIDPIALFALVWTCAVLGDLTSYTLGRRLGRGFMLKHGPKLKITEARLEQVEGFFDRRGGITILVGRFIGLVRALAPFIAGASRMQVRKFLPYDVIGAGLWAALFVGLGYAFSRSLGTVTAYVGRGLFLFAFLVGVVVAGIYVRRLMHHPEERARLQAWLDDKPGWTRFGQPVVNRVTGPVRFLYGRLTPGDLGLELTTLTALAAVGAFTYFFLGDALGSGRTVLAGDREAFSIANAFSVGVAQRIVKVATDLGSSPVTGLLTFATAGWALHRRRVADAAALVAGFGLTMLAVHVAKAAEARPRPVDPLVHTLGMSYPSGHAAYSIALIACAVVLLRGGSSLALRFGVVTVAVVLALGVGASRIYLRAHYLSDVTGGFALGIAVFSICAIVALLVTFVRHNRA
jgi:membrane protein DedA with SNARE-associated domain/membrane-associated phospholipid phosphatase